MRGSDLLCFELANKPEEPGTQPKNTTTDPRDTTSSDVPEHLPADDFEGFHISLQFLPLKPMGELQRILGTTSEKRVYKRFLDTSYVLGGAWGAC